MTDDTNPHALKRASIVEVPLTGEPDTDKAFKCADDGRTYRVRVVRVTPPVEQDGKEVADHYQAIRISVAELIEGDVNQFGTGKPVLLVDMQATILPETFANETPEEWLQFQLEREIYNASQTRIKQDGLTTLLGAWGNAAKG